MPNNVEYVESSRELTPSELKIRCILEWDLKIQIICEGQDERSPYPVSVNVTVSVAEQKNYRGTTRFHTTRVNGEGRSPIDYVLTGKDDKAFFISAVSADN